MNIEDRLFLTFIFIMVVWGVRFCHTADARRGEAWHSVLISVPS